MLFHPDLAYQVAGERRRDLERRASTHRLVVPLRSRNRRRRADDPALVNVVGLPPPHAGRDHHVARVA